MLAGVSAVVWLCVYCVIMVRIKVRVGGEEKKRKGLMCLCGGQAERTDGWGLGVIMAGWRGSWVHK